MAAWGALLLILPDRRIPETWPHPRAVAERCSAPGRQWSPACTLRSFLATSSAAAGALPASSPRLRQQRMATGKSGGLTSSPALRLPLRMAATRSSLGCRTRLAPTACCARSRSTFGAGRITAATAVGCTATLARRTVSRCAACDIETPPTVSSSSCHARTRARRPATTRRGNSLRSASATRAPSRRVTHSTWAARRRAHALAARGRAASGS